MRTLHSKFVACVFAATVLGLAGSACEAETVFQIGNSLTENTVPFAVGKMATSAGIDSTAARHTLGNSTLTEIWNNPESYISANPTFGPFPEALPNYEWDHIVMQASDNSSSSLSEDMTTFYQFQSLAEELPANADAKYYVYGSWPWLNRWHHWELPADDLPDVPSRHRREYFELLVDSLNTEQPDRWRYIPVGEVFAQVRERIETEGSFGGIPLVSRLYRDAIHAGPRGEFIAATTVFATLFRTNPIGLPVPENVNLWTTSYLTDEFVLAAQELVWEVVVNEKRTGVSPNGDINVDTFVDEDDFGLWSNAYGAKTNPTADVNLDGIVNQLDYEWWLAAEVAGPADLDGDGQQGADDHAHWVGSYSANSTEANPDVDLNDDGLVNAADYVLWRDAHDYYQAADVNTDGIVDTLDNALIELQQGWANDLPSDINGDGVINAADYTVWRDSHDWQVRIGDLPGLSASIPEPTSAAILALGLLACGARKRA